MLRASTLDRGNPVVLRSPARATAQDYRPAGSVEKVQARSAFLLPALLSILAFGACSSEGATPVDLDPVDQPATSATSSVSPAIAPDDQNDAAREQAREYATQQCLDDPEATEGVIQIVDPDTDQVAATVTVDCAAVRSGQPDSGASDEAGDQ